MTTPLATAQTNPQIARILLLIAACFVAAAFAMWGVERGIGALIGALLSVLNWLALRWLTARLVSTEGPGKGAASLLLIGKIGVLMGVVYILIQRLRIDPVGLAFGLGVLLVGPVVTSVIGVGRPFKASPATAAREER